MMQRCAVPHPNFPIQCRADARYRTSHQHHFASHNGVPVHWANAEFKPPEPKKDKREEANTLTSMVAAARVIQEGKAPPSEDVSDARPPLRDFS